MGPLQSLRILDFTTLLPGPFGTLALADMGADVLRIEAPHRADPVRDSLPQDGYSGAAHSYLNRNKRSIGLNLKCSAAVELVKELVQEFDIVVEQFRPGVMARLGIGYEDLRAVNPRLIFCSITGYGQTGPYRDRAGHDNNYLATTGLSSYTGTKASGPIAGGLPIADVAGGSLHGALGILAAVIHRQQTGHGQVVDIAMADAAFTLNAMSGAGCVAGGEIPGMESNALNGGGYYGYYETSDGRWMSVGSIEPHFLKALCDAFDVEVPPFKGFGLDPDAEQRFKSLLKDKFAAKTFSECCELFAGVDACVEPVLDVQEASEHPQMIARQMVVDVPTPDGATQRQMAAAIKFSETEPNYRQIGAAIGAHTKDVLRELGKSEAEIERLAEEGCFS